MTMDNARRFFLRGKFSKTASAAVPRPPWAIEASQFLDACTRCAECIKTCPTSILRLGDGGYPEVSFQANGCDACAQCVQVCEPQALKKEGNAPAWSWRAHIGQGCLAEKNVECRVCGEFCDHAAIRFKPRLGGVSTPHVQSEMCTGCGHCVSKCPTQAIEMKG